MRSMRRVAGWWSVAGVACALAMTPAWAATEVAGVAVPDETTVGGQRLVLNGAGLRTRVVFKVYVAALYLPTKKSDAKEAVASAGAKRVAVTLLRDVSSDELGEALTTGLRKNNAADDVRRFAPQLAAMSAVFAKIPKLGPGRGFDLDWVPSRGTVVSVDGRPVAEPIPDEAFYQALLRIWLGDEPADAAVKTGMLGGKT